MRDAGRGALICNWLVKPGRFKVAHEEDADEVAKLQAANANAAAAGRSGSFGIGNGGLDVKAAMFWAFVGIPLLCGYLDDAEERSQGLLIAVETTAGLF